MLFLEGKTIAKEIQKKLAERIEASPVKPCLAIIQIGNDERSDIYIKSKKAFGESIGAEVRHIKLDAAVAQNEVEKLIDGINSDASVHGAILQLPIPEHLNKEMLLSKVAAYKDVDGLASDEPVHTPATARGIMSLLKAYDIEVQGKKAVVIGTSRLVGAPTARCLMKAGAEVVSCDKSTQNIPEVTKTADILIVAAGSPGLITPEYVHEKQVVIDVGINSVTEEGDSVSHTVGDVDFPKVSEIVSAISPVPGGVGPLTVASLFENLFDAFQHFEQSK